MKPTKCTAFAFALTVLTITSCGKSSGELSGAITLNGEPLSYGQVTAHNEKGDLIATSKFLKGEYRIGDLPAGQVVLTVQTIGATGQPIGIGDPPPTPPGAKAPKEATEGWLKSRLSEEELEAVKSIKPVPKKYQSWKNTDLKVTVSGSRTKFDIQMTGKGEAPPTIQKKR